MVSGALGRTINMVIFYNIYLIGYPYHILIFLIKLTENEHLPSSWKSYPFNYKILADARSIGLESFLTANNKMYYNLLGYKTVISCCKGNVSYKQCCGVNHVGDWCLMSPLAIDQLYHNYQI